MTTPVPDGTTPFAIIKGEPIAQRTVRSLLGWLTPDEAAQMILGHNAASPEDGARIASIYDARRAAALHRPATDYSSAEVDGNPDVLRAVAERPELKADFQGVSWRTAWVDLNAVISIQKTITVDGLDLRVGAGKGSDAALAELCLPAEQPEPPLGALGDGTGQTFTLTSVNPNLRLMGPAQWSKAEINVGEGLPLRAAQAVTFLIGMGHSYVQVAKYHGRYFLRDGYHRAVGLIREGITKVPVVLIDTDSFDFISKPGSGLFGHELASSAAPPMLTDFWDDSVSYESLQPAMRKVIRVQGEEFFVQG